MQRGRALLVVGALLGAARLLPATADTAPALPPDPCTPATAPATGAPTGCEMPRPGCTPTITDINGDAKPAYAGQTTTSTVPAPGFGNNSSLDIRSIYLRLTPDYLESFLGIDQLAPATSMATQDGEYKYYVTFKIGAKTVTVIAAQLNPNAVDAANPTERPGTYPQVEVGAGANDPPRSGDASDGAASQLMVTGTSPNPSWVIVSTPRAMLEKALGAPVTSDAMFTNVKAWTFVETPNSVGTQISSVDSTAETGTAAQLGAFDDSCFGPPPTTINSVTVPSISYDHSAPLSAVLVDVDGKPIAGKTLSFTVQDGKSTTVNATTDANGLATAAYGPVHVAAGSYPVTVAFAGDTTTYKHSSATGTLKVTAAKTLFTALKVTKPSAKTRVVTTTLLDDAKKPVAGARVDWYANGKKVASSTTDKTGKAVFKTGKPGQTVQARYAGKPGMLLASASKSARL